MPSFESEPRHLENGENMYEVTALEGLELQDYIESLSVAQRIEYKRQWLSDISDRELLCRMVDDINSAEGVELELIN